MYHWLCCKLFVDWHHSTLRLSGTDSAKIRHSVLLIILWKKYETFHINGTLYDILFWYSAIANLTFGDWTRIYSHFCIHINLLILFSVISLKQYFTLLEHGFKLKVMIQEAVWRLFEVNSSFHYKVMIIFKNHKISSVYLPLRHKLLLGRSTYRTSWLIQMIITLECN